VLPAPGTEAVATPISAASVGDLVETPHGFEPIYFQGHASTAANQYIRVTLDSNHTLELSPDHYLPIRTASAPGRVEHMLAKDAEAGMALRLANDAADGGVAAISKVERVVLLGAYNPYTPSGELIVNGVVASCHSSWFLEGGYVSPSLVPSVYQALLAPLRALYSAAPAVVKRFADHFATANDNRPMSELKLGEIMRALAAPLATTAKAA